jgi:hypothetical protein
MLLNNNTVVILKGDGKRIQKATYLFGPWHFATFSQQCFSPVKFKKILLDNENRP